MSFAGRVNRKHGHQQPEHRSKNVGCRPQAPFATRPVFTPQLQMGGIPPPPVIRESPTHVLQRTRLSRAVGV
jgi:hypothetical protein